MANYDLPNEQLSECTFYLSQSVVGSQIGEHKLNFTETSSPLWMAQISTRNYRDNSEEIGLWSSFLMKQRGGLDHFLAYDFKRKTMLAYPDADSADDVSSGWDGTVNLSSVSGSQLEFDGAPSGLVVSQGDRVALVEGGRYSYHEFISGGTFAGVDIALNVWPLVNTTLFTTSAVATLWRPECRFKLDRSTIAPNDGHVHRSFSFGGIQRI